MPFSSLRRLDFPDLAMASDGNQLIENLNAIRARHNSATTGVFDVSFALAAQSAVQVGTSIPIQPPNYPQRNQLLVILAGIATLTLIGEEQYHRVSVGFHVSGTQGAGTATPLREIWFYGTSPTQETFRFPVYLQARVTYNGSPLYAFPQVYTSSFSGSIPLVGSGNRFDGHLFVKEI